MNKKRIIAAFFTATTLNCSMPVYAQSQINGTDIINLLVEEGILTSDAAEKLIDKVRQRNEKSQQQLQEQVVSPSSDAVRVPYVSSYVKKEIRQQVAQEVRGQVLEDIISHAKTERWGVPNAHPTWMDKVKFSGDGRLRYQGDYYDSDNNGLGIIDINAVNNAGRVSSSESFLRDINVNVNDNRERLRGRFRMMMKAKPTEGIEVGMRLTTGNEGNPVSGNQTLGNFGEKWDTNFDLAYIKYTSLEKSLTLSGGRFKNPFLHTDLVWDSDMTFEGISGTWNFLRSDDLEDDERQWDPFITIGAFPIDEINVVALDSDVGSSPTDRDKWLYAAQFGTHYEWWDQSSFSVGLSYYAYENITGVKNEVIDGTLQDSTTSGFYQFGNSAQFDIKTNSPENADNILLALASEYQLAALTMQYDYAGFAPYRIVVTADAVKNLAFDAEEVAERIQESFVPERDFGYQLGLDVGWPNMDLRGNWRLSFKYRRLEGDAVLDAFADSDFLLGGTNARGYMLRGDYAILDNVFTSLRWISAEEIDADQSISIAVDRLFLDINARF